MTCQRRPVNMETTIWTALAASAGVYVSIRLVLIIEHHFLGSRNERENSVV